MNNFPGAPSPRLLQPYSPRRPSPLGFPPLAPHMAWPQTPERHIAPKGSTETRVHFPPEVRRQPLAGSTQRRSQPPPPLALNTAPAFQSQQEHQMRERPGTAQPAPKQDMSVRPQSPPSPTPSSTSSLSLYSADSVVKSFPIETIHPDQRQEKGNDGLFCGCISLKFLFKKKESKILAPPPLPIVQTTQVQRRRPSPLNL